MLSVYKGKYGENIYTIAIKLYGDVKYSYKLFSENTDLLDDITSSVEGVDLVYDTEYKGEVSEPLAVNEAVQLNLSQTYTPYFNQSIFDIALQLDGNLESIISLVHNSSLESINTEIASTDVFNYQIKTNKVLDWVNKNKIIFATGLQYDGREHDSSFSRVSHS